MKVTKRIGKLEDLSFDKVLYRLHKIKNDTKLGVLENIDTDVISQKVIASIYDGVKTSELDDLAAEIAISMSINHIEYSQLASRIAISNMHKNTSECFSQVMESLFNVTDSYGNPQPVIAKDIIEIIRLNKNKLNFAIDYQRDYLFDYFGYKTLEAGKYLKRIYKDNDNDNNRTFKVVERPQHMWMRVSLGIHKSDIDSAILTYNLMSQLYFTHATPTLLNGGTVKNQLASCNLLDMHDSMKGIYKCMSDCAIISKNAGGIGVNCSNIRPKGSIIRGTNGTSDGIVKMLKPFDSTAVFANQGSARPGAFAMYLEPWHGDIYEFLELRKNTGDADDKCRNLFYAAWIPDHFMECVESDSDWYLMNPDRSKNLGITFGSEFKELYNRYVKEGKYIRKVKARDLWEHILLAQQETGMPYILYKDRINKLSNLSNYSPVLTSNLCAEICLPSKPDETAVCNICTFSLSKYIDVTTNVKGHTIKTYNFKKLYEIVKIATKNMNNVIDYTYYPTPETKKANSLHRPIAMGIQGLANTFYTMKYPFESVEAALLNKQIMETIQFAGWEASMEIARATGTRYSTFEGSPISQGKFQHDLWGVTPTDLWDWESLRDLITEYGTVNSMITALPPTGSTSQILGNYESFEPATSNMFMRSVLSGSFPIINKYLMKDLIQLNLWDNNMINDLKRFNGSIQSIQRIPKKIKDLYKTVWETPQKVLIDLSRDRGAFVDHSQSLNIYIETPTIAKLSSMHFYGWKQGLKTGMYYLRSQPAVTPEQITVTSVSAQEQLICSIENKDACMSCSG